MQELEQTPNTPTPPTPHRRQYWVWFNDLENPGELLEAQLVTVTYADQLRGELEAPRAGLGSMAASPMHYATIWVWSALVRTKAYDEKFHTFKSRDLGELEPVPDAADAADLAQLAEGGTPDPT